MASQVFVVTDSGGTTTRIRADRIETGNLGGGYWHIDFFRSGTKDKSARMVVGLPFSVIPQDMLFAAMQDTLIDPFVAAGPGDDIDFLSDALFSDDEKRPFNLDERRLIQGALQASKAEIHSVFNTTSNQQADIDSKIDYLDRKVAELDRFNWKRLFISTLVGLSVDLLFGTFIPSALLNAFRKVLTRLIEGKRLTSGEVRKSPG